MKIFLNALFRFTRQNMVIHFSHPITELRNVIVRCANTDYNINLFSVSCECAV